MQSIFEVGSAREMARHMADAVQALLPDVRRQVETPSPDSTAGVASLQAPQERGNALVADLRSYAGVQSLAPSDVEILPLLCAFAAVLRTVPDRRIQIKTDVERQCRQVHVDVDGLEEALLRLATNASDAMPDGGRLQFSARNGQFADGTPAVELSVIDSGAGMAAELAGAALRPFVTTKTSDPLAGMGLAAVDGFAQQSGGSLTLQSWVGIGTHAMLKLPAAPGR